MNLKHEKIIEEALRRHERGDGFETFLKAHPEVQSEVREMVEISKRISALSEHIPVPKRGFEKALRGIHFAEESKQERVVALESPYWMLLVTSYARYAVPALMVVLVVVGVGVYPSTPAEPDAESTAVGTVETMQMKMVPLGAESGDAAPAAFSASSEMVPSGAETSLMAADAVSLRTATIVSVDDFVLQLQQEATNEIAALSSSDAEFSVATDNGAAVLRDFNTVYDETSL